MRSVPPQASGWGERNRTREEAVAVAGKWAKPPASAGLEGGVWARRIAEEPGGMS